MIPAVEVGGARVFLGDCVEVMRSLPDNSVDSVVTDPPYGLNFMGKEWDNPGKMLGQMATGHEQRGAYAYGGSHSRGYADNDSFAFQMWCTQWATECLRVLKPGGHILAFGGSRTWHRLAVAVEDAGFELRDSIAWLYGSGFPKSLDVSKAIDKKAGAEREVLGTEKNYGASKASDGKQAFGDYAGEWQITAPATSEAKQWQGWGTALKPAFEPVVVGRKPLVGTVAENVLLWGVGGLNIDGSRIPGEVPSVPQPALGVKERIVYGFGTGTGRNGELSSAPNGRWPANVILDEVSAGLLDEQSGVLTSGAVDQSKITAENRIYGALPKNRSKVFEASKGGASRFFYVAKASKRDRNEGLEELEARRASPMGYERGLGDAGEGMFKDRNPQKQNFHPTVKPTQLMRYLIKLVTPEGGVVLDPFTGSGSTGKAALLDGYQFIGAELTEEYLPIIEGRLKWASEQEGETDDTLF